MAGTVNRSVFTVDLEDWLYSDEFDDRVGSSIRESRRKRLYINVDYLMNLLGKTRVKATFFVLGKLAFEEPELVRLVYDHGHEIACHGFMHTSIGQLGKAGFRIDLEKSIDAIGKACGMRPRGFRAANFSINAKTNWAYEVLNDFGFAYDSSIQPIRIHPGYGVPDALLMPHYHDSGIIEIPLSCAVISGVRIPCSGGGYFRHYPYRIFSSLKEKVIRQGRPFIFYIHPWELGSVQNQGGESLAARYRKYHNINRVAARLERLLCECNFISMSDLLDSMELNNAG